MEELSRSHKDLAAKSAISFFPNCRHSDSISLMRKLLFCFLLLINGLVGCTKKEPEPTPVAEVQPAAPKTASTGTTRTQAEAVDTLDLATQLRDPNVLNQIDGPESANPPKATNPPAGNKPVVIKASNTTPELPIKQSPTPAPPLTKPEVPAVNDANAVKTPGAGN
jgi:hypothetical protein